jgi:hypothetical protein
MVPRSFLRCFRPPIGLLMVHLLGGVIPGLASAADVPSQQPTTGPSCPGASQAQPSPVVPPAGPPDSPPATGVDPPIVCPRLSPVLRQLSVAPDPATFAAQHGIAYADGRVRVEIELATADSDVPAGYELLVEARYQRFVQALAPADTLCDLANDPRVSIVRPTTLATPTQ